MPGAGNGAPCRDCGDAIWGDLCCVNCEHRHLGKNMDQTCPETSRKNPVKAIRLKCLDCSGGSSAEVAQFRTVELSEEEREKRAARLREIRASRKEAAAVNA